MIGSARMRSNQPRIGPPGIAGCLRLRCTKNYTFYLSKWFNGELNGYED